MRKAMAITALAATAVVGLAIYADAKQKYEEPQYEVVDSFANNIEIRQYGSRIAAEVVVPGQLDAARSKGFRILAGYIFGNNRSNSKVSMTAPVMAEKDSEKIPMTSPVTAESDGGNWRIRFFMPSSYTKDSLPAPVDDRIVLVTLPAQRFAAIRFAGSWSKDNFDTQAEELIKFLSRKGIASTGEIMKAHYNPPWTPSFLRRNEILIPLL